MRFTKEQIIEECFSFNVAGYTTDFVDRKSELISALVAGAPSLSNLLPMEGAKAGTTVELPLISTTIAWQTGDCVTSANTTTTITPRTVSPVRITNRESLCLDSLDSKLPMLQKAGANNEELPFAEVYMGLKIAENSKQIEKLAFRGDLTGGTGNLAVTDGWLAKANAETGSLGYYATFSGLSEGQASVTVAQIRTILSNRTDELRERDDAVIYCAPADFEIIANAIVDTYGIAGTGLYMNSGSEIQLGNVQEMFWPGSNVKIKATHGLSSNNSLFCTYEQNLRYTVDLASDQDTVDMFFDKYHRALVSDIIFTIGFNYEQPAHVLYVRKV